MKFNWQQPKWPKAHVNRDMLKDELLAFAKAFASLKSCLESAQDQELTAETLTNEAVVTSAIEGVKVDETVVMSSICRALGVVTPPMGFAKDARAEGVSKMMLAVREGWKSPLSAALIKAWHRDLMLGDVGRVAVGDFRKTRVCVVCRHADGTQEILFEAPPSAQVPEEIRRFVKLWKMPAKTPAEIAIKSAMIHPHFESIHPFEDGNGRVGRALVAKVLAEGLGAPIILPISTIIARHHKAYYEEINAASHSLDWTNWCAFFIPVLTELLTSFVDAAKFIVAKRAYLERYGQSFSNRSKKVILRMFDGGEKSVTAGLSTAKWMRMAKVSKPTAVEDLSKLEESGAIVRTGLLTRLEYHLAGFTNGTLNGTLNDPINDRLSNRILKLVTSHPGVKLPYIHSVVSVSRRTVARAVAALVKVGKIEHRGSKKTGGYFITEGNLK